MNDAEPAPSPIRPKLRCKRLDPPSAIDGDLAKPPWREADVVSLRMFDGSAPSYRTDVRAMWDECNLYVAFDAEDPEPVGTMTKRDDPLFNDGNVVEMFVDPAGAGRSFFEFEVNPLGTLMDLFFDHPQRDWREAVTWDARDVRIGVRIQRDANDRATGWSVEAAIPLANFHTAPRVPPRAGDVWRVNFYRYNTVSTLPGDKLELYAWSPTLQRRFDLPERFGELQFA